MIERTCGRGRRENAGISSESKVRIFAVESLRFPGEGSSAQGKSGPKVRPKKRSRWIAGIRFLHYRDIMFNGDAEKEVKRARGKARIAR